MRVLTSLSVGQVLTTAEPFVHMLNADEWGKRCHYCMRKGNSLIYCCECHVFRYCGKKCQIADWNAYHKLGECDVYRKSKGLAGLELPVNQLKDMPGEMIAALRTYLLITKKPEMRDKLYELPDGSRRSFRDLERHGSDRSLFVSGPLARMPLHAVKSVLKLLVPHFNIRLFMECLAKVIGAAPVPRDDSNFTGVIGIAIFVPTSFFPHSCEPNLFLSVVGRKQEVRVLRPVPAGQQLTVAYVPYDCSFEIRRQNLLSRYSLTCKCPRCRTGDRLIEEEVHRLKRIGEDIMTRIRCGSHRRKDKQKLLSEVMLNLRSLTDSIRQMIGSDYDPHLVTCMMDALQVFKEMAPDAMPQIRALRLVSDLNRISPITFGTDHPVFAEFVRIRSYLTDLALDPSH